MKRGCVHETVCIIVCCMSSVVCLPRVLKELNELRVVDEVAGKRNGRELFCLLFLSFAQSVNGQPEPRGRGLSWALEAGWGAEGQTEPTEPSPPAWWLSLIHISRLHPSVHSSILSGVCLGPPCRSIHPAKPCCDLMSPGCLETQHLRPCCACRMAPAGAVRTPFPSQSASCGRSEDPSARLLGSGLGASTLGPSRDAL